MAKILGIPWVDLEVDLCTETALFRAAVPSGASTGIYEAVGRWVSNPGPQKIGRTPFFRVLVVIIVFFCGIRCIFWGNETSWGQTPSVPSNLHTRINPLESRIQTSHLKKWYIISKIWTLQRPWYFVPTNMGIIGLANDGVDGHRQHKSPMLAECVVFWVPIWGHTYCRWHFATETWEQPIFMLGAHRNFKTCPYDSNWICPCPNWH